MSVVRILGQRLGNSGLIARRQRGYVGHGLKVLQNQLPDVGSRERPLAREQFLIADSQTILVAKAADPAVECFWGGVNRRNAAGDGGLHPFKVFDQAEVGNLDVLINDKKVLRLDVQVLQLVLVVHQVEGFGGFFHVIKKLVARYAGQSLCATFLEAIPERLLGQLHDNNQLAFDHVEAFERQDIGMAHGFDAAERF